MDFKKHTKAELISAIKNYQIKKLEEKLDLQKESNKNNILTKIKSYFVQLWNLISTFKDILAKLTFISLLIGLFRKYKIFRRIWFILNSIIITIFSIFSIENFGIEFLTNFITEIRIITSSIVEYLSNTDFYNYLNKLFNKNNVIEEVPSSEKTDKSRPLITEISSETIRNESSIRQNSGNSKISEWLKPEPEVIENKEINTIENKTNYIKYIIIGSTIIIISSLGWIYLDEIKTAGNTFMEWLFSSGSGGSSNQGGGSDNSTRTITANSPISSRASSPDIEVWDKKETKVLTSPSLEDLNTSVSNSWESDASSSSSSSSSTETITPSISNKYSIDSLITDKVTYSSRHLFNLATDWKHLINTDIKNSMEYIEKHLPKNELDDITYISELLHDINIKNTYNLENIVRNTKLLNAEQIKLATDIAKNLGNWIDEMKKEIEKFE